MAAESSGLVKDLTTAIDGKATILAPLFLRAPTLILGPWQGWQWSLRGPQGVHRVPKEGQKGQFIILAEMIVNGS